MVEQKLLDFVKKMLKDGVSEATIKRQLLQRGWPEEEVNSTLELAKTPKSPEETLKEILPDVSEEEFFKVKEEKITQPSATPPRKEGKVESEKVSSAKGVVKKRNIVLVYLFMFITLGIYAIYWSVTTKNEMNRLGANIPTAWLMIIPFVQFYWSYKYCEGFSTVVKKDNNTILWFLLFLFVGIVMPGIIQSGLNKISR